MVQEYNIKVRENAETPVRQAQLVMLEMLKVFDGICQRHKLQYWLDAGTLLGAVRHRGFIPWDDDLDVCMPRQDYEQFLEIAQKELPMGMFFQTRKTDKKLRWKWIKLRDNFSTLVQRTENGKRIKYHQGIFIDIFPYDLVNKDFLKSKLFLNRRFEFSRNRLIRAAGWLLNAMSILPVKLIGFERLKRVLLRRYTSQNPLYVSTGIDITVGYHTFDYCTVFPFQPIEFEGYTFQAPNDSSKYLTKMFGDYMQLPPMEKRKTHAHMILPFQACVHPRSLLYSEGV